MVRINDLPNNVLRLILYYAGATLGETLYQWKAKLPLVAVCRTWTKLAQDFVFHEVYVEVDDSHSHSRPSWTSNAKLIISRGCILKARRLTISLAYLITPECLQTIALELLQLDCVDWQHVNALTIASPFTAHEYYLHIAETEEASDEDIAHTMKYFARNLRNVVGLKLGHYKSESRGNYICASFATLYGGQLQVHKASKYILFNSVDFFRNIKVLELTLDSSAARVLPCICGETLRVLKLYDVPRNFAWHHFRYDIFDRPIVFHRLTILHLYFDASGTDLTESEIQDKVVSGAHCCDQLSFPALRELVINNCTPDCDLLYADLPFPELKNVYLCGSVNSIRHCCRLKLTWVRDLHVDVFTNNLSDATDFYGVTNHLFTNIRIGRAAVLNVCSTKFILDPELIRWVNLTHLSIARVDYTAICKSIGRLPNLAEFLINNLEFGDTTIDGFSADSLLFNSVDPMLAWGAKLTTVSMCELYMDYPVSVCVGGIQALILHAGALKKLSVPESTEKLILEFIDVNKDRHPHLANIQLDWAEALVGYPRGCAAQNILNTCLSIQGIMFNSCAYSDWGCKCAAQRTIASCFNNCPDDDGRIAQEGQVKVYCNAAMRDEEQKLLVASQSQAAKTSTAAPAKAKAVPSSVEVVSSVAETVEKGSAALTMTQAALGTTQSLGKVDRANHGSMTIAVDNSAVLRGVSNLVAVFAVGIMLA
ncbi:hypothetical protein GGI01_002009 [Coemansia sp. RSA 376]|nr:hypothetical protein GGI01_002009 [Coemansia sp. RSA 376]